MGQHDADRSQILDALAEYDEFEIDLSASDTEVTSDRVAVDTPEGWLGFDAMPPKDYGGEHDRHDPDADVFVNMWFHDGYTVVHVQTGTGEDATHTLEVHQQRPDERAIELQDHGIPERCAEIASLRERGLTYSEIVEATGSQGPNHRGDVSKHLQRYNAQIHRARWLAENADPVELGRTSSDD